MTLPKLVAEHSCKNDLVMFKILRAMDFNELGSSYIWGKVYEHASLINFLLDPTNKFCKL